MRLEPAGNAAGTLAESIGHARGTYVAFMAPDGIAHPERLARQLAFLETHPDHAAVSAWVDWVDGSGRRRRTKRKPVAADEVAARRLFRSGIEHVASLARTAVLREHVRAGSLAGSGNFDLWARIAAGHKLSNLPEILLTRRRTGDAAADPELRQAERGAVYGHQLTELGIAFTDEDLRRHFLLRRMRKEGFAPDIAFVVWAEAWLRNLLSANARTHAYPEPVFSEVLGTYWVKVCWHGSRRIGAVGGLARLPHLAAAPLGLAGPEAADLPALDGIVLTLPDLAATAANAQLDPSMAPARWPKRRPSAGRYAGRTRPPS